MTVDFEAIHPGMQVLDANAELVGTVSQVAGPLPGFDLPASLPAPTGTEGRFRVRQEDNEELEVPFTAVQEVDQDRVVVSCTKADCTRYRVRG
jgi:sporulation protein YlmC with PRC-barrel domain